jgi:hypothetical protein
VLRHFNERVSPSRLVQGKGIGANGAEADFAWVVIRGVKTPEHHYFGRYCELYGFANRRLFQEINEREPLAIGNAGNEHQALQCAWACPVEIERECKRYATAEGMTDKGQIG